MTEVIVFDISCLVVAGAVWLNSSLLLGLCSFSAPQVSDSDSLSTLISIPASSAADSLNLEEKQRLVSL